MTSLLARRLAQLSVPQTKSYYESPLQKPSLLFNPKEAATLDLDTVLAIGINGIEELDMIVPLFKVFKNTLFSDTSKHVARSTQTRAQNDQLDKEINKFLQLISPLLLLKPAHKALEWLVHRFHIHSYNCDDLILCALPYHETKIFVRIVQLVDFSANTRWLWLQPLQKSGVSLPKRTLINHLQTDLVLLNTISKMVSQAMENCEEFGILRQRGFMRTKMAFYATTVIGLLVNSKVSENLLTTLLPHIMKGLRSQDEDYAAVSYMITAQLLKTVQVKSELVVSLVTDILKGMENTGNVGRAMNCVLVIFLTQETANFPNEFVSLLCSKAKVLKEIVTFSQLYGLSSVIRQMLKHLFAKALSSVNLVVKKSKKKSQKVIDRINYMITNAKLSRQDVIFAVRVLLRIYRVQVKSTKKMHWMALRKIVKGTMTKFENRFPTEFDAAIKKMSAASCPVKVKVLLAKFMFVSDRKKGKSMTLSSLAVNTMHADANRRALVTRYLVECLAKNECGNRVEFMREALLARLADDQECVITEALNSTDVLMMLPKEKLTPLLMNILNKKTLGESSESYYNNVLKVFCEIVEETTWNQALVSIIPFLFIDMSCQPFANTILQSSFARNHPVLRKVTKEIASCPIKNDHCNQIQTLLLHLGESIVKVGDGVVLHELLGWKFWGGSSFPVVPLLVGTIMEEGGVTPAVEVIDWLTENLKQLNKAKVKGVAWKIVMKLGVTETVPILLEHAKPRDLPFIAAAVCFNSVIRAVKFPDCLQGADWWLKKRGTVATDSDMYVPLRILNCLLDLVNSKNVAPFKHLIRTFISKYKKMEVFLKLLTLSWTPISISREGKNKKVKELAALQVKSLCIAQIIFKEVSKTPPTNLDLSRTVVPALLVCLSSPVKSIRRATLDCFQSIDFLKESTKVYKYLVSKICQSYAELHTDESLLPQFVKVYFEMDKRKSKMAENQQKREVLESLLRCVTSEGTPLVIGHGILQCLREVVSTEVLLALLPMVSKLLDNPTDLTEIEMALVEFTVKKFVPETADVFRGSSSIALDTFLKALSCVHSPADFSRSPQAVATDQITRIFFDSITDRQTKEMIFEKLIVLQVDNDNPDSSRKLAKALKNIAVYPEYIIKSLEQPENKLPGISSIRKKKQVQASLRRESDDTLWKRVVILLEVLQRKKNVNNVHLLIPAIFDMLKKCLEVEEQETMEYVKQLLLTLVYHFCGLLMKDTNIKPSAVLKESHFSIELVIQSLRTSKNPQTHNQALLLIGVAARIFPDYVLHNTMAIFTFMGANLLRQDDSYSSQVIMQTLDTLIPALISKRQAEGMHKDVKETIVMVIRVFVDALPDIPQHRRGPIFTALASRIGAEEFLWILLALLLESYVTRPKDSGGFSAPTEEPKKEGNKMSNLTPEFEFMLQISNQYSAHCQLSVCAQLMKYLHTLPVEKDDKVNLKKQTTNTDYIFNTARHSGTKLRYFKYATLGFISLFLSNSNLVSQLVNLGNDAKAETLFRDLLECTMKHLQLVAVQCDRWSSSSSVGISTAKFWRATQHKVYDVLEKVNSLLPSHIFVKVTGSLLDNERASVRRKAMDMLNAKLQHNPQFFQDEDIEELLGMLKQLVKIVRGRVDGSGDKEEMTINMQTALFSIKLLCKMFGQEHHESFKNLTEMTCKLIQDGNVHPNVCASGLIFLSQLCQTIGVHIISHIGVCVSSILGVLGDEDKMASNELLLVSGLSSIHKFVERLHHFLSPYLHSIITTMCSLTVRSVHNSKPNIKLRLSAILQNIATTVAPRVLFPVIASCSREFCEGEHSAMEPLMDILCKAISSMDKENVAAQHHFLLSYFFSILDFRAEHQQETLEDVEVVEGYVIEPILSLVLKMSEAMFRPFYFKLYDWATRSDAPRDRVLVFYRLSDSISEKLKSLFVLFAGHIVKHAASVLDKHNKKNDGFDPQQQAKGSVLVNYVIDCLYKCCLYDNEGFVNKERFDYLMQPLVDQIENTMGTDEEYDNRIAKHLVPCLGQLAVAASDESLWKTLNYEILLKTRHSSPKVRLATLDVVHEISRKLGDNYMILLPETIPFLAELMEDESNEVEQKCRLVVSEMEKSLGESIQDYF